MTSERATPDELAELREWLATATAAILPARGDDGPRVERVSRNQHVYSTIEEWRAERAGQERTIVVKRYRNLFVAGDQAEQHLRREHEALTRLWPVFREHRGLAVPRPLGYLPQRGILAMEKAPGIPLDGLLRRFPLANAARSRRAMDECGAWLAILHDATEGSGPAQTALAQVLTQVQREAEECGRRGIAPRLVRAAWDYVRRSAPDAIRRGSIAGWHGDFGPGNILVQDAGITVIDFTFYRVGSMYQDLGYIMGMLEWLLWPRFQPSLHRGLLRAYTQRRPLDREALRCFRVAQMIKIGAWSPVLRRGSSLRAELKRRVKLAHLTLWLQTHLP